VRQRIPPGDVQILIHTSDGMNTASVHDPIIARFCEFTNGGVETCDGLDNDCDGVVDNAAVPTLTGGLQVTGGDLSWDPVGGASEYDVIHGDLLSLRSTAGDFAAATAGCLAEDLPAASLLSSEFPGTVGTGIWYLVRARNCGGDATWDSGGASQDPGREGAIGAAPLSCPDCAHSRCETGDMLDASCDSCVAAVCAGDPFCCDTRWDSLCVQEIRTFCGNLTCSEGAGSCSHTVCREGGALVSSCDDPPVSPSCVADVCAADPFCCNTNWDWICVSEVESICGANCN
jgi:hypothetical protein